MVYLILYEFSGPEKNYQKFFREIHQIGKWEQPLKNTVVLCSDEKANAIYFRLKHHLTENDNLLIVQAGHDWFGFLSVEKLNWLQEILG